jgi:hypothetical protein
MRIANSIAAVGIFLALCGCESIIQHRFDKLSSDLQPGLTRQEVYARIRADGETAYNRDVMVNDGKWPEPGSPVRGWPWTYNEATSSAHPWVVVGLDLQDGFCRWGADFTIYFDSRDKVSRVTEDRPNNSCP